MDNKDRIKFIDAMRGFTMLLVVAGHVASLGMGFDDLDKPYITSIRLLLLFRMPLFFFISGFIAYRSLATWTSGYWWAQMKKKSFVQLIPAAIFLIVYVAWMTPETVLHLVTKRPLQMGEYWFTYVLFVFFVIYYAISWLAARLKSEKFHDIALIVVAAMMFYIYISYLYNKNFELRKYNIDDIMRYFQFFVLGVFCRKYYKRFSQFISNEWFNAAIIVLFFIAAYISLKDYRQLWIFKYMRYSLACYAGVVIVFTFFKHKEDYFASNSRVARALTFIGTRTLDIYLIHFFFIPPMQWMVPYIEGGENTLLQWGFTFFIAILITGLCLIVSEIIRSSDILAHWLLGVSPKKKKS